MAARRGHGEGSVYQRHDHPSCPPPGDDGGRPEHRCRGHWVGTVDLGVIRGKRRRKTVYGRTRREATAKVQGMIEAKRTYTLVTGTTTVEAWLQHWLDEVCPERRLKANTLKGYRSKIDQYLTPELGSLRLDRLEPEHVRGLYNKMRRDGRAEATIRQTHAILRRALLVAQREGKVARNVATLIDAPGTERHRRTGLTLAQAERVLDGADLRWWVALMLGLRQGEALALRWSDIDLDEGYLRVERNLVRVPGRGLVFDTPKSASSRRIVPLPDEMAKAFRLAWERTGGDPAALVFHRDGKPWDHRADWQAWSDRLDAVGVPHAPLHAARNTTASILEELGYPARMVAEILGQSDVRVTHGYQSADYARRREALTSLAGAIKALPAAPDPGQ